MATLSKEFKEKIFLAVKDPDGQKLSTNGAAQSFGVARSTVQRLIKDFESRGITVDSIKGNKESKMVSTPVLDPAPAKAKAELTYVMGPTFINITTEEGKLVTITSKSDKYKAVQKMVIDGNLQGAIDAIDTASALKKYTQGMLTVDGDKVKYADKVVSNSIIPHIIKAWECGDSKLTALCSFLRRLLDNPSKNSIDLLWGFIEHNDVTIDTDGCIVAWKKVTSVKNKLFDSYSKKVPNDLGTVVKMIRSHVVEDPNVTCTHGLHVGAWSYVGSFSGDTILKVKIAPEDVVSVPKDYNAMKMRVAKYFVTAIVDNNQKILAEHTGAPARIIRCGQNGVWEDEPLQTW